MTDEPTIDTIITELRKQAIDDRNDNGFSTIDADVLSRLLSEIERLRDEIDDLLAERLLLRERLSRFEAVDPWARRTERWSVSVQGELDQELLQIDGRSRHLLRGPYDSVWALWDDRKALPRNMRRELTARLWQLRHRAVK